MLLYYIFVNVNTISLISYRETILLLLLETQEIQGAMCLIKVWSNTGLLRFLFYVLQ